MLISKYKPAKQLIWLMLVLLSQPAWAIEKSSSMLFNLDKTQVISANFDAGSVSILARDNGELIAESTIGRDIRRIALTDDGKLLLATDYLNDQVVLLDAKTLQTKRVTAVPSRPFGVVYDSLHQRFFVTSFESDKLLVINTEGEITQTLDTASTPRGLALTDDGRMLVTHSLSGQVSIYNVRGEQLN